MTEIVVVIVALLLLLAVALSIYFSVARKRSETLKARAASEAESAPLARGDIGDLLKRIRALEIKVRHLVDEMFAGSYHSVFKGQGMNFEEVREYQAGDEIRSIDWNVTARLGDPYVKLFTEERELSMVLLVDLSASGNYGSSQFSKREIAAEVAATFAFSAIRNSDRVALILFTNEVELYLPPGKGRSHVLRVIREVLYYEPKGRQTDIADALRYLNRVMHRRSIAFLISDFHAPDFTQELALAARRHDLNAIQIRDPLEAELPDVGRLMLQDEESGELVEVNTGRAEIRRRFAERARKRQEALERLFLRNSVDFVPLRTDADYLPALRTFFQRREKRLVR